MKDILTNHKNNKKKHTLIYVNYFNIIRFLYLPLTFILIFPATLQRQSFIGV